MFTGTTWGEIKHSVLVRVFSNWRSAPVSLLEPSEISGAQGMSFSDLVAMSVLNWIFAWSLQLNFFLHISHQILRNLRWEIGTTSAHGCFLFSFENIWSKQTYRLHVEKRFERRAEDLVMELQLIQKFDGSYLVKVQLYYVVRSQ